MLELRQPMAFDLTVDCEATGRFVIVDGYDVAGGGIITAAVEDDLRDLRAEARCATSTGSTGGVTAAERAQRHGHRAALVMFVGKAGRGEAPVRARAREGAVRRRAATSTCSTARTSCWASTRTSWVDAAQSELVRRFGEVVHLLLDAGLIVVSTTNAIGLADGGAVQALIPDSPLLLIDIDPDGSSTQDCDLRIRGTEPEAQVIAKINELLAARKITALG